MISSYLTKLNNLLSKLLPIKLILQPNKAILPAFYSHTVFNSLYFKFYIISISLAYE